MAESDRFPSGADALRYLDYVTPERRRMDARHLAGIYAEVTGFTPVLWPGNILGYGRYDYTYESGRTGTSLASGFAPRKASLSLYIMPGYAEYGALMARLGPHKTGAACLYITRLDRIDEAVLRDLIRVGLDDLAKKWPVHPI